MKKLLLTTSLTLAFMGVAQAQLDSPQLLMPTDSATLPTKKAAKFTWSKVAGAKKYRLIFSNDQSFANFDVNKFKCLNAKTCFLYTVSSPSYNVAATHAILKANGNYFWQVQAVGKTTLDNSKNSVIRSFSVGTPTPPSIDTVRAVPNNITLGKEMSFRATLDKPLLKDFYSLKISVNGEEFQPMTSSNFAEPIKFSFSFTPTEIGDQQFQVSLFDKNDIEIDSLSDGFTVVENSQEFEPTVSAPIIPNIPTNTPNEGTTTSGSNKFDGNWNLKGTIDASNCGMPTNGSVSGIMPIKVTGNQVSFPYPAPPSVPSSSLPKPKQEGTLIDENTISYQVTFPTVDSVAGMPSFPNPSISGQLTYNGDGTISVLEKHSMPAMKAMPEFGMPATKACVMTMSSIGTKM